MRLLLLALLVSFAPTVAAQEWEPAEQLAPLAPLVGAPWRGTFEQDGQSVTDVSRFEWAMRGQALRNVHTLEGGGYGGETLIWAEGDSLRFVYVTSGGFSTSGTGSVRTDGALVVEEAVEGHPEIDRVRSVSLVDAEGRLQTITEFRRQGAWSPGRSVMYVRTPEAALAPGYAPACEG
ncbi:hypothetical protein [Rubrivirga marina]|uniref:Secreted protein n=1 Tax=Rubrivirga marina TaxID=1196024 RepID=A0A271IXT2_9BACT|nr:hypothetical protein [Rubrivirga marina]PAP75614.1 hypothetical protein BSZ37_03775 [Rubrivirga marina]